MVRRRNPIAQALLASLIISFGKVTGALPLRVVRALAKALARPAYYAVPRIRRVGLENLDRAYGDSLSRREKVRILKKSVENAALVAVEFSHIPVLAASRFEGHVAIKGMEHVDLSRGALCIAGHLGNWEWMAPAMASCGYKAAAIFRPFDHPRVNAVIDGIRRAGKMETIPKADAGRKVISLLKDGWLVGVMIDQSMRENAVPARFFGSECWSTIAPAILAARTRCPVHPVTMIRDKQGHYTFRFYPALDLVRTGKPLEDMVENTQRCQIALEELVREHPEQWLWFHRRWKRRERLEKEWQERLARARSEDKET